ncbi:MAG: S53 family serine peptidase [Solirubrobacteraceae bacterium]
MLTGRIARLPLALLTAAIIAAAAATPALAKSIPGTSAFNVRGATKTGALHARSMSFALSLAPRHEAALNALVAKPHAALSHAQFNSRFAPSTATVKKVRSWAKTNQLTVTSVAANRLVVNLRGNSTAVARAFSTHFATFHSSANGSYFAVTKNARVPRSFASSVVAVLGLSSLSKVSVPHPAVRSATDLNKVTSTLTAATGTAAGTLSKLGVTPPSLSSIAYPSQYDPQQFWSMYDAPSSATGTGQQLAIITEGDLSQPKKDLATFESKFGLPTVTWNQIDAETPGTDTSGDDEWDLDSQYSTGFAPGVTQLDVYVGASLNDDDILTTVNKWVSDDIAKQGSFSAGECDLLSDVSGFTAGLDNTLKAAVANKQTMFFSSGDTGSQCPAITGVNGVPAGIPDTNYPASSPYGIGVGGTSVLSPTGPTEIGWYAGGGGFSPIESAPAFQSSTKVLGVAPMIRRGVPDVSLDADPESGYEVIVSGSEEVIGGTSASAPSWQGIWARVEGAKGNVGFAGPILYSTEPSTAFHDITIGDNGLYPAGPGYDLVTGLGTPDIAKLVAGA